jgi:hypothetical protein
MFLWHVNLFLYTLLRSSSCVEFINQGIYLCLTSTSKQDCQLIITVNSKISFFQNTALTSCLVEHIELSIIIGVIHLLVLLLY